MTEKWESAAAAVQAPSAELYKEARAYIDTLTKPVGSLGRLEEIAARLYAIQGGRRPLAAERAIMYTVAGDHGVTAEKVTLSPQEVTGQMVYNMLNGGAGINALCRANGIDLRLVDAGCVAGPFPSHPMLKDMRLGSGTANFAEGPAMSRECCCRALEAGIFLAGEACERGYNIVCMGELGIGNSTAAAAMYAAYLKKDPSETAGKGAGLPVGGLEHKAAVIAKAFRANPEAARGDDPLAVLAAFGGYEIAVKAGIVIGCALKRLPLIADGFISTAACLAAGRLCPASLEYVFLSHKSAEITYDRLIFFAPYPPLLSLDMRLGEGTGAALAVPLLRSAAAMFNEMATFEGAAVTQA